MSSQQISWNSAGDGVGYAVGYGTSSMGGVGITANNYTTVLDVGNVTSVTLNGLTPGVTYYVGVSTYGSFAETSTWSEVLLADEISFVAGPNYTIVHFSPLNRPGKLFRKVFI